MRRVTQIEVAAIAATAAAGAALGYALSRLTNGDTFAQVSATISGALFGGGTATVVLALHEEAVRDAAFAWAGLSTEEKARAIGLDTLEARARQQSQDVARLLAEGRETDALYRAAMDPAAPRLRLVPPLPENQ